jgi:hypothetical protein
MNLTMRYIANTLLYAMAALFFLAGVFLRHIVDLPLKQRDYAIMHPATELQNWTGLPRRNLY